MGLTLGWQQPTEICWTHPYWHIPERSKETFILEFSNVREYSVRSFRCTQRVIIVWTRTGIFLPNICKSLWFEVVRAGLTSPGRFISIYLSICLSICLSVHLSIHPSIYPSIYLSIYDVCSHMCLSKPLTLNDARIIISRRLGGWEVCTSACMKPCLQSWPWQTGTWPGLQNTMSAGSKATGLQSWNIVVLATCCNILQGHFWVPILKHFAVHTWTLVGLILKR